MELAVASAFPTATPRRVSLETRLISFAENWFDIPEGAIQCPKRRNGNISKARYAVAYVLNTECGWSFPRIGRLFGRDHSAILLGKREAEKLLRSNEIFFEGVKLLKEQVAPHDLCL